MSVNGRVSRRAHPLTPRAHPLTPRADPLTPRAVRMRNACVRHAAARLGLESPGDAELSALADDMSLHDAVEWWQARARGAVAEPALPVRPPLLLRAAVVSAVTLLALALSYRPVQ